MRRILLFLNGEVSNLAWCKGQITSEDIICVDGGANYALELGLKPNLVIGDLDSIKPSVESILRASNCQFKVFPPEKDLTDTQIALDLIKQQGCDELIIIGGLGGRLDHTLSNIFSLVPLAATGCLIRLLAPNQQHIVTNHPVKLTGKVGKLLSILALTPQAKGITTEKLKYPLYQATISLDHPYAISNEFMGEEAAVGVEEGIILISVF